MTSMKAMQALQPQINALRTKYKSDPQRLQRETMELYRTHKVNPLGGCLPMVVAGSDLLRALLALSVSVELQNASFICARAHVRRSTSGSAIWRSQDPTYVLPILMGVIDVRPAEDDAGRWAIPARPR